MRQAPSWTYKVKPAEQEDPAVLMITQVEPDPSARKEIELIDVFKSFGKGCIEADVDPLPKGSIKPLGNTGPWKAFDTYHKVATITEALKGEIILTTKEISIPCKLSCHRINVAPRLDEGFDRQFTDREALHLMFQLRDEWEFNWVEAKHIRVSLENAGLLVISCVRPTIANLGSSGYQGIIHVRARPINPTTKLFDYPWPMYFSVEAGTGDWHRKAQPLLYEISEHDAVSGKLCLRRKPCHRPFRPRNPSDLFEQLCSCHADDAARRAEAEAREARNASLSGKRKNVSQGQSELRSEIAAARSPIPTLTIC